MDKGHAISASIWRADELTFEGKRLNHSDVMFSALTLELSGAGGVRLERDVRPQLAKQPSCKLTWPAPIAVGVAR